MLARRLTLTLTTLVWLLFLGLFHLLIDDVAAGYQRHVRPFTEDRVEPPAIMKLAGLPILGRGYLAGGPEHWLYYLVRAAIAAPPLALLLLLWRASTAHALDVALLYGVLAYGAMLAVIAVIAVIVGVTLWVPFKCC